MKRQIRLLVITVIMFVVGIIMVSMATGIMAKRLNHQRVNRQITINQMIDKTK